MRNFRTPNLLSVAAAIATIMPGLAALVGTPELDVLDAVRSSPRFRVATRGAFGRRRRRQSCRCYEHPAGTKLVRRFIRHSGTESVYNRRLYAQMTGRQYR